MAELQIEKSTVISQLEGSVFVISADGSVIRAKVGMALQPGDREFNFEVQFPIKNQAAFRSSSKTTCG
ncbi:hypothetical protein, partial [Aeromonas veronii]|uniref:hypothetical protein n=1 Tax=Aeromonas veronii TaxID=654 RepID=UPI003D23915D